MYKGEVSKEYLELVELAYDNADQLAYNILGKHPFIDERAYKEFWMLKKCIFKDILRKHDHVKP